MRASVLHLAAVAGLGLLGAAVVWLTIDGRDVAERAGRTAVALRDAVRERDEAAARVATLERDNAGLAAEVGRLQRDMLQAFAHAQALGDVLTDQLERHERAAVAVESAEAMSSLPPPYGVQRCLVALCECLHADGFTALRFVGARELRDATLIDAEVLDVARAYDPEVLVAAALTLELDRTKGELALVFRDGFRRSSGVRAPLPPEGYALRLSPVDGRRLEQRLPYLVRARGAYPEPPAAPAGPPMLEPAERAVWIDRLDSLLATAGTEYRLRLVDFHCVADGCFQRVRVLGYDKGKLLALAADCSELAVEIDERANTVSLLLREGTLQAKGGRSTIDRDGYRVLLPDVTPQRAVDAMLGMVVRR